MLPFDPFVLCNLSGVHDLPAGEGSRPRWEVDSVIYYKDQPLFHFHGDLPHILTEDTYEQELNYEAESLKDQLLLGIIAPGFSRKHLCLGECSAR
jgi:hypothetical protein